MKCFLFLSRVGKNSGALWEGWSLANSAFVHDVSLESWNAMPCDVPNVSWATRGVSGYAKYPGWSLRWLTMAFAHLSRQWVPLQSIRFAINGSEDNREASERFEVCSTTPLERLPSPKLLEYTYFCLDSTNGQLGAPCMANWVLSVISSSLVSVVSSFPICG